MSDQTREHFTLDEVAVLLAGYTEQLHNIQHLLRILTTQASAQGTSDVLLARMLTDLIGSERAAEIREEVRRDLHAQATLNDAATLLDGLDLDDEEGGDGD